MVKPVLVGRDEQPTLEKTSQSIEGSLTSDRYFVLVTAQCSLCDAKLPLVPKVTLHNKDDPDVMERWKQFGSERGWLVQEGGAFCPLHVSAGCVDATGRA